MTLTRRRLLQAISASTFAVVVSPWVRAEQLPTGAPCLSFPQGVASADPQTDSVMLWTRAIASSSASETLPVLLEVSEHEDFSVIVTSRLLHCCAETDFTARVHLSGLEAGKWFYYRFRGGDNSQSVTGRTRTAPAPDDEQEARLALVSCQSFEQGFYGAWARMLADDIAAPEPEQIDFVLHVGDFIYERIWPTRVDGGNLSRRVPDFPDGASEEDRHHAVSLADYRHLYKTYLSDPHLQAARARWPFISTWDDHEFSNNCFQSFSTYSGVNRQQSLRKLQANRAWFEYIPAALEEVTDQPSHGFRHQLLQRDAAQQNQQAIDSLCIYRKLQWGRHLDLLITDNRSYRSEPCISDTLTEALGLPLNPVELVAITDAGREYNSGEPPEFLPFGEGDIANPAREREPGTCLGQQQRQWLLDEFTSSTATWKIWANSLPLIPLNIDLSTLPFAGLDDSLLSIDSWAGYPGEVNWLCQQLQEHAVTGVVSLSGDHHMHGAGTVSWASPESDSPPAMVDFTVAGISSTPVFWEIAEAARESHPAFQSLVFQQQESGLLPVWHLTLLDGALASMAYQKTDVLSLAQWLGPNEANRGLRYVDTSANGYALVAVSAQQIAVEFVSMQDITQPFEQPPAVKRRSKFTLPSWVAEQGPTLQGPEFTGPAPFPFGMETV